LLGLGPAGTTTAGRVALIICGPDPNEPTSISVVESRLKSIAPATE
jgi:hypothetical protein